MSQLFIKNETFKQHGHTQVLAKHFLVTCDHLHHDATLYQRHLQTHIGHSISHFSYHSLDLIQARVSTST